MTIRPIFFALLLPILFICFTLSALAKTHSFTILPSGDIKHKSDEESAKDLKQFVNNLPGQGREHCSRGVREAIQAEYGIDIFKDARPGDLILQGESYQATIRGLDYMLRQNGYYIVPPQNYLPQKGDVQGIMYLKKQYGHAQYFDGAQWISDHVQTSSGADPGILQQSGMTSNDIIVVTYRRKK